MEKEFVDKTISGYLKKIYGFALSKTKNIDLAEELASKITYEVYISLLNVEQIFNVNSYIYKIANNIYNRFLIEEKNESTLLKNEIKNQTNIENQDDVLHAKLLREITYLSKMQREIVVMHYFNKIKLKEIASYLKIPIGTVSWHLREARDQLKHGITEFREVSTDTEKHEIFSDMRILGYSGVSLIESIFYFKFRFSQKIAYLAYHKAKTPQEIAQELSIPAVFVENEINYLLENGFMLKMPCNKYLTNIYIIEQNFKRDERVNDILKKYARIISELYIPSLFTIGKKLFDSMSTNEAIIFTPEFDYNFLMWSIVSYACSKKLNNEELDKELLKYMIKRPDGGKNIAIANIKIKTIKQTTEKNSKFVIKEPDYIPAGTYVSRRQPHLNILKTWLFHSQFDNRTHNNKEFKMSLFETLNDYIKGKLNKSPSNIDSFIPLYEKSLITSTISEDMTLSKEIINIIITNQKEDTFLKMLPNIPKKLKDIGYELDAEMFKVNKEYFPEHIHGLCRVMNQNILKSGQMRIHILNHLLETGMLNHLKKHQKKTVNMILFSDVLP